MNDLLPITVTNTISEVDRGTVAREVQFGSFDTTQVEGARLDFNWEGQVRVTVPRTWTEAERMHALSKMAEGLARLQCFVIVQSLPQQVVQTILPQLQDLAEYELSIWQLRQQLKGPDIREKQVFLPIRK